MIFACVFCRFFFFNVALRKCLPRGLTPCPLWSTLRRRSGRRTDHRFTGPLVKVIPAQGQPFPAVRGLLSEPFLQGLQSETLGVHL